MNFAGAQYCRDVYLSGSELIDSSKLEVKDLMSSDMYREMLREKWEEEQQDLLSQDAVHYANVRFDGESKWGVPSDCFALHCLVRVSNRLGWCF